MEMLVGNKPWPGCIPREEAYKKKEFFQRFAEGQVNLTDYGVEISPIAMALLRNMLQKDPSNRIDWPQLFEHPFIKYEPAVY